jgi:thiazole synthase
MLIIDKTPISNRLLLGTALFPSPTIMQTALQAAHAAVITVSLKRQSVSAGGGNAFWDLIKKLGCFILPNTAGCHSANDAITTAEMAREIFETHWVKLEVIGDDYNLQPDPFGLVEAASALHKRGFHVLPYCTDDLVLAKRLIDCGCTILMPWAAPIGSGLGLTNPYALSVLRERLPEMTLIVDAGLRSPAEAAEVMQMGYDAVLVNSAVALASDPVKMASAFSQAVAAGRLAFEAGLMPQRNFASPSTPVLDTPFWHQELHDA